MTIPAWFLVLLAIPVLLLGEWLIKRITVLGRFYIPAPVVGGLLISVGVLIYNLLSQGRIEFLTQVTAQWWTWLVTIEPEWIDAPAKNVTLPLMVGFFTCIGLNATWDVVRKGGIQVVLFLGIASLLAVMQNCIGIGLAKTLGVDPLIGLLCGSVSLTGGHGTAIGFAPVLEKEGLVGAATLGAAAATMGLLMGSLIGGPVGSRLIKRLQLKSTAISTAPAAHHEAAAAKSGVLQDFSALRRFGWVTLMHLLLLVVCIKAGAWISHFIQMTGLKFPPQIGAMVVGVLVRNAFDLLGWRWIRSDMIDVLASVALGFFLTVAMMSLNLIELANAALPMLVILLTQVVVVAIFATWVTFRVMGRDYDAAVMAAGHCGFGLGATPNAVANMKAVVEKFGPAPRAFLIVPLVGAILIDFTNSLTITLFLNLMP